MRRGPVFFRAGPRVTLTQAEAGAALCPATFLSAEREEGLAEAASFVARGRSVEHFTAEDCSVRLERVMAVPRLLAWSELQSWQQDNHYILDNYRESSNSFKKSFHSLTYLHNETVNVYTHLLGAIAFSLVGVLLYHILGPRYSSASLGDIMAFACFFSGAALCLGMSGFYHLIMNHSQPISSFGNKLDYLGIVFLIAGSYAPMVYYGFYCYPDLQLKYWTMVRQSVERSPRHSSLIMHFSRCPPQG